MSECSMELLKAGKAASRTCQRCGLGPCSKGLTGETLYSLRLIPNGQRKVYVAGPMRGIAEFNFPAFNAAAAALRAKGWHVFNPAEKDNERHGTDISKGNATGDESKAAKDHGFNLREALALDLDFICRQADAIALLPGWEESKGANAEHATAVALGLEVYFL